MKRNFILSMLIPFAMICSCQKQDSTAEQQLAQRKTELDTREDALIEREKALDERVNALAEKVNALDERVNALAENEKAAANARMIPPAQSSDTISDSGKDRITKERLSEAQGALKELMSQKQPKWQMSGAAGSPTLEAASPTSSPTPQ